MKPRRAVLPLALAALAAPFLRAATTPPPTAVQEPSVADLAWMSGHWAGEADGTRTEEVWLAPAGGLVLGMNRSVGRSERASFEYLRIETRKEGLVYVASPGGKGTTDFPLADLGERFVLFENPEHDFPQRIRYELDADGALHARVSAGEGAEEQAMEWVWKKE